MLVIKLLVIYQLNLILFEILYQEISIVRKNNDRLIIIQFVQVVTDEKRLKVKERAGTDVPKSELWLSKFNNFFKQYTKLFV